MRISSYSFISILLKLHRCFVHGLKICMWFGYNHEIIFYHFFCKLNFVIFQALLLSTYVDNIYLVRVTTPMNFTFSDDSLFLKKILGGGHKFSEFACFISDDLIPRSNSSFRGTYEPRCEKTGLRGFRPGPTQTELYNHRRKLEA